MPPKDRNMPIKPEKNKSSRIQPRVRIMRTEGEMIAIDKKIKELGKKDLHSYLYGEIAKLEKKFLENPKLITAATGDTEYFYHCVSPTTYNTLKRIAALKDRSINSVVEDLIITPLLHPTVPARQDSA